MTTATVTYTADPDRILAKASHLAEAMQASSAGISRSHSSRSLRIDSNPSETRRPSTSSERSQKSTLPRKLAFADVPAVPKLPARSNTTDSSQKSERPPRSSIERSVTAPEGDDLQKTSVRPALLRTFSPDAWPLRKSSDGQGSHEDSAKSSKSSTNRLRPQDILIPSAAREHALEQASPLPNTPRLRESTYMPDIRKLKYGHPESGKLKSPRPQFTPPAILKPNLDQSKTLPAIPPVPTVAHVPPAIKDDSSWAYRDSVKSTTTYMSSVPDISTTERSSYMTDGTSASDLFGPSVPNPARLIDDDFTVDDCIDLYAQGFEDDITPTEIVLPPIPNKPAVSSPLTPKREEKSLVIPKITIPQSPKKEFPEVPKSRDNLLGLKEVLESGPPGTVTDRNVRSDAKSTQERRPSAASGTPFLSASSEEATSALTPPPKPFVPSNSGRVTSAQIIAGDVSSGANLGNISEPEPDPNADRYGFKKYNQNISLDQYEAWNTRYVPYLDRRRQKWNELMKQHSLNASHPVEFPPRSDKVKRFIRKGIPPDWRGAAWFWYAGGPARLAQNPGLYQNLVDRCEQYSQLGDKDREPIERDLYRTFPDNDKYKRLSGDPNATRPGSFVSTVSGASHPTSGQVNYERPMICALRRVLRAYAVYQPHIGYCQSLNFLAGLLLLFLDGDEEKAFHLLCILTNEHLPGTHGKALEGANVDIGVLMSTLKDKEPSLWVKLDDRAEGASPVSPSKSNKLPTVSLATTSWFMSCFVGSLPIEPCLRVWDVLFYEGSKTLFRVALGIFRLGAEEIRTMDPMELLPTVQALPRKLIDANLLMETSFGRDLEGRGLLSQDTVKRRREERRSIYHKETKERQASIRDRTGSTSTVATAATESTAADGLSVVETPVEESSKSRRPSLGRGKSLRSLTRLKSKKNKAPPVPVPPTPGGY